MNINETLGEITARNLAEHDRARLVRDIADNVLKAYSRADNETRALGRQWYITARDIADGIARRNSLTREQAASLIALLSPRKSWDLNILHAEQASTGNLGFGPFAYQRERIPHILRDRAGRADLVKGPKVSRFLANILGDWAEVTVDIWAIRVACDDTTLGDSDYKAAAGTPTRYDIIADGYRLAASEVGLTPAEVQAITWVQVRNAE